MNMNTTVRGALAGVRRHPARAAAICVPLIVASVLTGTSMASARPEATLPVSAAAVNAAPAQHVLIFDNHLTAPVAVPKPAAVPTVEPVNLDGCDHDYGTANFCVPWSIPGSTSAAKCAWLASNGFGELRVYGTNRQDLPENAQGDVCAAET
jgi:hypothetical protein